MKNRKMTTRNIPEKLSEVLKLFLLPNYNVVSTTYLDLLLTHLSNNITEVEQHDLLKKWILEGLETWSKGDKPCQAVGVFTLKLVGVLSRNEHDFDDLSSQDTLNKLFLIFNLRKDDLSASMKMAYTSLLVDIISHKNGRKWVISSGIWNDMVKYAQLNPTMYVTRESHKFIYTLLQEESQNIKFCKEIILAIVSPLLNNKLNNDLQGVEFADILQDQHRLICTTFDLITSIYENLLFRNMDLTIPDLFEELADLSERTKAFIDAWISTRLFKHVQTLWVLLCFYKIKKGLVHEGDILDVDSWENFRLPFCTMQFSLMNKKNIIDTVKSNKLALMYWKKLQELRPFKAPYEHKFEHQNIALMIIPMSALMNRGLMQNDFGEMFIDKLFNVTSQPVQRICYHLKDVMTKEKLNSEKICKASIEMLLEIIDIMDRSVAVITFQSMCYTLKNYMPANKSCSEPSPTNPGERPRTFTTQTIFDGDPIVDNPLLLSTLLHGLAVMTEKFQFKWPDCLETICVLSLAQGILNHPGALPNLCVKALQLCKLAIQNFMPPNLALLVESDMNDIGTTLYKRLHDPNWEVRDSVLEVLTTIAQISENKYPAFQNFLIVHKFLTVSVDIFMTDGESYVRASALKFISSTIKINSLWDEELLNLNLPDKTIKLYRDESEAIVRREAVTLIKELYVFRKWQKSTSDEIKATMAEAVVLDLHWEVKINALEFWRYFIKLQFEDQGMLDGCFPNVTFSKENRKIVSLNELEIKKRLNKALDNMANENCLGVLISSLKDESDFEVSKSSALIISELKIILLKYKIDEPEVENNTMLKDFPTIDTTYVASKIKPEIINDNSSVLDDIVDANDANLLSSIYENSLNMDGDKCENYIKNKKIHDIASITRDKFLSVIINTDIDAYIEERKRWLKDYTISFDSVLEDIITVYHQKGINNSMDCY